MPGTSVSALIRGSNVPIGQMARDLNDAQLNKATGFIHDVMHGIHHPPGLGLDVQFVNNGAALATVTLDGVQYNIVAGGTKSISNHPFTTILVTLATSIDIYIDGVFLETLEELNKGKSILERFSTWL